MYFNIDNNILICRIDISCTQYDNLVCKLSTAIKDCLNYSFTNNTQLHIFIVHGVTLPSCGKRLKDTGIIRPKMMAVLMCRKGAIIIGFLWTNFALRHQNNVSMFAGYYSFLK